MSGLLLKNNIRSRIEEIDSSILDYIKNHIFDAIGDGNILIRNTVSTVICTMVTELGPSNWSEALNRLMELLNSPTKFEQEVSFFFSFFLLFFFFGSVSPWFLHSHYLNPLWITERDD